MPPIIDRHQLSQMASSCNITDDKSLSRASRTLHEFGSLVHFESDPKLQDLVILSPRCTFLFSNHSNVYRVNRNHGNGIDYETYICQEWSVAT
jgi:hypothetical protein